MRVKEPKSLNKGQAAVEYVLLVAVCVLIFGAMFSMIRINLYRLWVCEIAPRVQAPAGCRDGAATCFNNVSRNDPSFSPPPRCN